MRLQGMLRLLHRLVRVRRVEQPRSVLERVVKDMAHVLLSMPTKESSVCLLKSYLIKMRQVLPKKRRCFRSPCLHACQNDIVCAPTKALFLSLYCCFSGLLFTPLSFPFSILLAPSCSLSFPFFPSRSLLSSIFSSHTLFSPLRPSSSSRLTVLPSLAVHLARTRRESVKTQVSDTDSL